MGSSMSQDNMTNPFLSLPPEVVALVLSHLDAKSILSCRCVSKQFEEIISNSGFWLQTLLQSQEFQTKDHKVLLEKIKDFEWKYLALLLIKKPFYKNLLRNGSAELETGHEESEFGHGNSRKSSEY